MPSVFDVAKYILEKMGPVTAWKLQKLVYYSQAWSVVWDEEPLFEERIEAWANGPVVPELFKKHKGLFKVSPSDIPGDSNKLEKHHKETIDAIVRDYGDYTSQYLSDLTHMEDPWKEARGTAPEGARSSAVISLESLQRYYESLSE
jgi:uncharacterized phage-associated protein